METEHRAGASRERELIVKALTIAIAAMDIVPHTQAAQSDRKEMAEFLTRLAEESELERYRHFASMLISEIAGRRAG